MEELVALLKEKKLTIASCESLTGGLFADSVVSISGASSVFVGALVTYATRIKHEVAQVDQTLIDTNGVVSEEVASAMARNVARIMKSDIGVSFTGNAGPGVMEDKPAGLVYSAISYDSNIWVFEDHLQGTRTEIRCQVVEKMKSRLLQLL
ncbi:MAG: CinA family protein [Erysipelotrichaceae bacterium]|nr:CinA family protein [Erysipelotrichaceae bacterium]